jgi:hypothetical protein
VKFDISVVNLYDNGIILKAPVSFQGLFIKGANIRNNNMAVKKYSRLYRPINLFIFRM